MATEPIRSRRNPRVIEAIRLHRSRDRRSLGKTLIEGPNLLTEAIEAGVVPEVLFATPDDLVTETKAALHDVELLLVAPRVLKHLAGTKTPRGPVGVVAIPDRVGLTGDGILVSWGVSDPGNAGSMIRVAAAFGWGFAYTSGTADPWSPKVLRAGAGSQFGTNITPVGSVVELTDSGYTVIASTAGGGKHPASLTGDRYAVLIGEEASGLPVEVVAVADEIVSIPMPGGTESLNAAVAAGILVYELANGEGERPTRV
jgi:TrmH family RNA methyltransferase